MSGKKVVLLKKIGKIAGNIISVLSVVFIVYAVYKLGFDFDTVYNWPLFLTVSFVSVILKCFTVYVTGNAWQGWLSFFSAKPVNRKEAVCVYAKANIGKYLPGNVMHYVERNLFAGKLNISQKKLAAGTLIEVLGLITAAVAISVCISAKQLSKALNQVLGASYLSILLAVLLLCMVGAAAILFLFRRKLLKLVEGHIIGSFIKQILRAMVQYAFVLISLGVIMVALYAYMGGPITWENGSLIISGYIIAWVLGFIIPGAPGGIGVRELVLTVLLEPVVGEGMIVTLSIIHRFITVLGDFLAYLIMLVLRRVKV